MFAYLFKFRSVRVRNIYTSIVFRILSTIISETKTSRCSRSIYSDFFLVMPSPHSFYKKVDDGYLLPKHRITLLLA